MIFDYMKLYLAKYNKPCDKYINKISIFKNNKSFKFPYKILTKYIITSYFIIFYLINSNIEMVTYKTNLYKKDYILCFIFSPIP